MENGKAITQMFVGGFLAGVATTALLGSGYLHVFEKRRTKEDSTTPQLDHMVIRTRDAEHLQNSIRFWKDNFEFEAEREEEAALYLKDPANNPVAFPSIRINDSCVLDLFPIEMKPFYCKKNPETNIVDHFCLNLPGAKILQILDKFAENNVEVSKVVGDFNGKDGDFSGPWGAKGKGISVYLHDPNGMYCELRTYELDYVAQIREMALALMKKEEEIGFQKK